MTDARIFISYARSEFYFSEAVAKALTTDGLDPWLDIHRIYDGDDWAESVQAALESCDQLVLIGSPAAIQAPQVRREWEYALAHGKPITIVISHPFLFPAELQFVRAIYDLSGGVGAGLQLRGGIRNNRSLRDPIPTREGRVLPLAVRELQQRVWLVYALIVLCLIGMLGVMVGTLFLDSSTDSINRVVLGAVSGLLLMRAGVRFIRLHHEGLGVADRTVDYVRLPETLLLAQRIITFQHGWVLYALLVFFEFPLIALVPSILALVLALRLRRGDKEFIAERRAALMEWAQPGQIPPVWRTESGLPPVDETLLLHPDYRVGRGEPLPPRGYVPAPDELILWPVHPENIAPLADAEYYNILHLSGDTKYNLDIIRVTLAEMGLEEIDPRDQVQAPDVIIINVSGSWAASALQLIRSTEAPVIAILHEDLATPEVLRRFSDFYWFDNRAQNPDALRDFLKSLREESSELRAQYSHSIKPVYPAFSIPNPDLTSATYNAYLLAIWCAAAGVFGLIPALNPTATAIQTGMAMACLLSAPILMLFTDILSNQRRHGLRYLVLAYLMTPALTTLIGVVTIQTNPLDGAYLRALSVGVLGVMSVFSSLFIVVHGGLPINEESIKLRPSRFPIARIIALSCVIFLVQAHLVSFGISVKADIWMTITQILAYGSLFAPILFLVALALLRQRVNARNRP
jgi:hypothetical protein